MPLREGPIYTGKPKPKPTIQSTPENPFQGKFEPFHSPTIKKLTTEKLKKTFLCSQGADTETLKQACENKDYFMASSLRSSGSFKEAIDHTDGMKFKDKHAVVLYPGADFHVAPIAEMGEALLKKHNLEEVEFIFTEIKGLPGLRDLIKALLGLIKAKNGWKIYAGPEIEYPEIKTDKEIERNGSAFSKLFKIVTPHGIISINFKNAMSEKNYYLDEDLQRANFFISHDLFQPGQTLEGGLYKFVYIAIDKKKDKNNFMVIAEDLTRPTEKWSSGADMSLLNIVAHTKDHYGCGKAHKKAYDLIANINPPFSTEKEYIDVGKLGLIDPKVLDLTVYGYRVIIDPNEKKVMIYPPLRRLLFINKEIKELRKQDLYIYSQLDVLDDDFDEQEKEERKKASDDLFNSLLKYLGISGISKKELNFKISTDDRIKEFEGYYIKEFVVPPKMVDPKLFQIIKNKTMLEKDKVAFEFVKPGWKGAMIIRPKQTEN